MTILPTFKGFLVYGIDQYAHGKSSGTRGLIDDYKYLQTGFLAFAEYVKSLHPSLPIFVLAHSMGTLTTLYSINKIDFIHAIVLSGVALKSGADASSPFGIRCLYPLSQTSFALFLTRILAFLAPKGSAAPIPESALTTSKEHLISRHRDPLYFHGLVYFQFLI